jgi:hypothetical protein
MYYKINEVDIPLSDLGKAIFELLFLVTIHSWTIGDMNDINRARYIYKHFDERLKNLSKIYSKNRLKQTL